jgi:mannose-6-phosphate isomerase-like protein (cupin superfamily)
MTVMDHKIVRKPWGYEYVAFQNDCVALKVLHIRFGERTSLHCHPNKSTGLILVEGEAIISFIADQAKLTAPAKKMIRRGLFHQTQAVSNEGITMIEVETPVDQDDLVRLRDSYGRENKGYEDSNFEIPRDHDCLTIVVPQNGINHYRLGTCTLDVCYVSDISILDNYGPDVNVVFLEGGLIKMINDRKHLVTQPGDVGQIQVVKQVANEMNGFDDNTIAMFIK